jgi:hypothetical protein
MSACIHQILLCIQEFFPGEKISVTDDTNKSTAYFTYKIILFTSPFLPLWCGWWVVTVTGIIFQK